MNTITTRKVKLLLPFRDKKGDKRSFGRVLCIAGSQGFTGAPFFASEAAALSGCGMVRLIVPESIYTIEAIKLNEVMVVPEDEDENGRLSKSAFERIIDWSKRADSVLIGPGCGINKGVQSIVKGLITTLRIPLVLDADAINVICDDKEVLKFASCPIIITPHSREFARLYGKNIRPNSKTLLQFASDYKLIVIYKEAETRIASYDGNIILNKCIGNSGMAKGGSGDILSGIVVSLLAQGLNPFDAALVAVYIHTKAGEEAKDKYGERGMLPTNILEMLPNVLQSLEQGATAESKG